MTGDASGMTWRRYPAVATGGVESRCWTDRQKTKKDRYKKSRNEKLIFIQGKYVNGNFRNLTKMYEWTKLTPAAA